MKRFPKSSTTIPLLALILLECLALSAFGATPKPARPKRQPTRITFDDPEPKLEPGKIVKVKATVFDQNNAEMPAAEVKWDPLPKVVDELVSVSKPLDGGPNVILLTGKTSTATNGNIVLRASSGSAMNYLVIHFQSEPRPVAKEITFVVSPEKGELSAGSKTTITATVLDRQGNPIPGAEVDWAIDKQFDDFAGRGTVVKGTNTSKVEVFGRTGNGKADEVPVMVVASSQGVPGFVRLTYKPAARTEAANVITFDSSNLPLKSGEEKSFKVTVKDKKGAPVDDPKITAELVSEKHKPFLELTKPDENGKITVTGLAGNPAAEAPSVILINVKSGSSIATFPILYARGGLVTSWDVLPPNICGDNFGRTIKSDFYCIEVAVRNDTGGDVSLAGMGFNLGDAGTVRPSTSYSTVHGSLARRKLTHPRTLTLAAADVLGTVMTGFNPFFHNLNHAKNFSQWIDIVSNPIAKGIDKVWKDSYVDEVARLENDVLRDGKIILKGDAFKTKIFFPKKALFPNMDGKSHPDLNDIAKVRAALGKLVIMGYKFDRGNISVLSQ
jgi:hypothetical protein